MWTSRLEALLTETEFSKICKWMTKGAKVYFGRDYAGRSKIKVVRGPLGIFTARFRCEERDIVELNRRLHAKTSIHA
jgi:hypothetical protein